MKLHSRSSNLSKGENTEDNERLHKKFKKEEELYNKHKKFKKHEEVYKYKKFKKYDNFKSLHKKSKPEQGCELAHGLTQGPVCHALPELEGDWIFNAW